MEGVGGGKEEGSKLREGEIWREIGREGGKSEIGREKGKDGDGERMV